MLLQASTEGRLVEVPNDQLVILARRVINDPKIVLLAWDNPELSAVDTIVRVPR